MLKSVVDPNTQERRYSSEVFSTLRLNMAKFDLVTNDFVQTPDTETVYLVAGGGALARVIYDTAHDLPSADGQQQHVYFTLTDSLGSTSVVIDKASSELVEASTYQAYGATEIDYRPARWHRFERIIDLPEKRTTSVLGRRTSEHAITCRRSGSGRARIR